MVPFRRFHGEEIYPQITEAGLSADYIARRSRNHNRGAGRAGLGGNQNAALRSRSKPAYSVKVNPERKETMG
jgi:hypothetical protein